MFETYIIYYDDFLERTKIQRKSQLIEATGLIRRIDTNQEKGHS